MLGWIASDPVWSKIMQECLSKCSKSSRTLHKDIKTSLKRSWSDRNRWDVLDVTLERLGAFCQLLEQNRGKSVHPNPAFEADFHELWAPQIPSRISKRWNFWKNVRDFLIIVVAGFWSFFNMVFCIATAMGACIVKNKVFPKFLKKSHSILDFPNNTSSMTGTKY